MQSPARPWAVADLINVLLSVPFTVIAGTSENKKYASRWIKRYEERWMTQVGGDMVIGRSSLTGIFPLGDKIRRREVEMDVFRPKKDQPVRHLV